MTTDEGRKVLDDAARRAALTVWGEQPRPMVLALTVQLARWWLVQNDEFLSRQQGSYKQMIATPYSVHRLRGWHGMLVVLYAERTPTSLRWHDALDMVTHIPGISIWTEVLP